jgi:hypothetical protein
MVGKKKKKLFYLKKWCKVKSVMESNSAYSRLIFLFPPLINPSKKLKESNFEN